MKIDITTNSIKIYNPSYFSALQILECGQIFRYSKIDNYYRVISADKICKVYTYEDRVEIVTYDVDYFYNFFDLDTDYSVIASSLSKDPKLARAVEFGRGIRLLKQQPLEIILSFIISANNNIPRIKSIIERLCMDLGTDMGEYYAFPTLKQLSLADKTYFDTIGAGYRANYLYNTVSVLAEDSRFSNLDIFYELDTNIARYTLKYLKGVGRKVADCILLFAFQKMDVFPVDTWIVKVYIDMFGSQCACEKMSEQLSAIYGNLSGYAQQYLFYMKREYKN